MGSWKGCPSLRNEYWFGLNGGRIWYKEWFGLLAMALKRPASAVPANCSTVQTRLASCHRCALRNKPFIRPVEHAIDQLSMPLTSWACHWPVEHAIMGTNCIMQLIHTCGNAILYYSSYGTIWKFCWHYTFLIHTDTTMHFHTYKFTNYESYDAIETTRGGTK